MTRPVAPSDGLAVPYVCTSVAMDGLLWGKSKLVDVAFGVKKLQINAVIEDEKVSTDDLQDQIEGFEDYVQSMDVVAFQKI